MPWTPQDGETEWICLGPVPSGTRTALRLGACQTEAILLVAVAQTLYAVEAVCPHHWVSLERGRVLGEEIECPAHRARFNLRTGERTYGPTRVGLKTCPVRIANGSVWVQPPLRYLPQVQTDFHLSGECHVNRS